MSCFRCPFEFFLLKFQTKNQTNLNPQTKVNTNHPIQTITKHYNDNKCKLIQKKHFNIVYSSRFSKPLPMILIYFSPPLSFLRFPSWHMTLNIFSFILCVWMWKECFSNTIKWMGMTKFSSSDLAKWIHIS